MLESVFQQVYKWEKEKGISNDDADKGGMTNDGITIDYYYALCKKVLNMKPTADGFKKLTVEQVRAFYTYSFNYINCHRIIDNIVAAVCFDFAFNSQFGKREMQQLLQKMGYRVVDDNIFGNISIDAINSATKTIGTQKMIDRIMDARIAYLNSIVKRDATQKKFLEGWLNRCKDWRNWASLEIEKRKG